MSDLLDLVTPLTVGIIWFHGETISSEDPHYQKLDYLLDGLLTASAGENASKTQILIGQNFGRSLHVLSIAGTTTGPQFQNYLSLFEKDLKTEDRVLIVGDSEAFEAHQKLIPTILTKHLQRA